VLQELDITCSTAGRGQILVGDRDGTVVILDKLLNMTAFRAHNISISLKFGFLCVYLTLACM